MDPRCLSCIVNSRIHEICRWSSAEGLRDNACKLLTGLAEVVKSSDSVTTLAVESFRAVCEILNMKDPYREDKERANRMVADALREILPSIRTLERRERLRALTALTLIGNAMDPCVYGYAYDADRVVDEMKGFKALSVGADRVELMLKAGKTAYLVDNAGEFVLDLALAEELARSGVAVELVVKGEPYETDVTLDDVAELVGSEIPVISTHSRYPAFHVCRLNEAVSKSLASSDLIISKGIANYESLIEMRRSLKLPPVIVLMKAKCDVMAKSFGVGLGDYVVEIV